MWHIFRFRLSEKELKTFKISVKENKAQTQCRGFCYKLILNLWILSVINNDICVFYICRSDNLNYNIYPLVVIILHKNTRNTFSNTVWQIFNDFVFLRIISKTIDKSIEFYYWNSCLISSDVLLKSF
jgi:hypothetical protein